MSLAIARWLEQRRRAALALWLVLVALAALGLPRLAVDNGLTVWFAEDDPQLRAYRAFQQDYGHDEALVALLPAPSGRVGAPELARLRQVSAALAALPDVQEVRSLSTVALPRGGDDWLSLRPLVPAQGPLPPAEALVDLALADPLLVGTLITADASALALHVRLTSAVDDDVRRDAVLEATRGGLAEGPAHLAGVAVLTQALNSLSRTEGARLYGVALLVIAGGLGWVFGRARPALLAGMTVALASLGTLGLAGWMGRSLNLVTMVVPTLVLVLGVADCVHLLLALGDTDPDQDLPTRRVQGIARVLAPCGLTTLTTAVGFLSLLAAPMPVLQELGWLSAAGVVAALVSSLVVVAAGVRGPDWLPHPRAASRSGQVAGQLTRLAAAHPRAILAGLLLTTLGLAAAATTLQVDTDSAAMLPADHPVRQDLAAVEAAVGGVVPLEFTVHDPAGVLRPTLLSAVEDWTARAQGLPGVGWTGSLIPALQRLERALDPDGPGTVPTDPARLDQVLLLQESRPDGERSHWVRPPDELRVNFGVPLAAASELERLTGQVMALAALPPGATLSPAGYVPLYVAKMDRITRSTLASFGTSLVAVLGVLALTLRSGRLFLIALPPTLLPLAAVLGGLALTGRPLDAATSTVAAIVLGLVVDDTVHLLHRTRQHLASLPPEAAVQAAARSTGRALVATTGILVAGLGVLATAQVGAIAGFGLWAGIALVVALLADLLAVPAGVVLWQPRVNR